MPNRILREGILTSPRIARLGWAEEVFYRRLMSVVDDFGRYYADPGLLRGHCYPRQLSKVSDSDIGKWLTALVEAALVRVYPASDGESYLELLNFGQQVRAKASKYPDPAPDAERLQANASEREQAPSNAPVFVSVSVSEDVSVSVSEGGKARKRATPPSTVSAEILVAAGFDEKLAAEFIAHKAAAKAPLTERAWADHLREAVKAGWSAMQAAEKVIAKGWKGFEAKYVAGQPVARAGVVTKPPWKIEQERRAAELGGRRPTPEGGEIVGEAVEVRDA